MSHERYYILQIYRESFLEQLTYFYCILLPTSRLSNSWLSKRSRSGVFSFSKLKTFVEFWTSAWFLSIFSISIYSWSFSSVFFFFFFTEPSQARDALVHEIQAQIGRPRRGWRCRKGNAAYLSCLASQPLLSILKL